MKRLPSHLLILLALLIGCNSEIPQLDETGYQTITPSQEMLPSATPSRVPTLTSTITPAPPKPTLITPSATPILIPEIVDRCLQYQESEFPKLDGILALSETGPGGHLLLLNLQDRAIKELGIVALDHYCQFCGSYRPYSEVTVSPDGRWIAYYDSDKEMNVVTNSTGAILLEISSPSREITPAYWLDNEHLLLNKHLNNPMPPLGALIILNPFTGAQETLLPEFPQQSDGIYEWRLTSNLVINPDQTRLIYPAMDESFLPIRMWDLQNGSELARIYGGGEPIWSPDGKKFLLTAALQLEWNGKLLFNIDDGLPYVLGGELLIGDLLGNIKRLTYFSVEEASGIESYVWSPDSNQITFQFLNPLKDVIPKLMVLNITENTIVNYCETSRLLEYTMGWHEFPPGAVWSPDGEYLAITQYDEEWKHSVYIVELATGKIWLVAENAVAKGWMAGVP